MYFILPIFAPIMARVKFGGLVTDLRGSVGGSTFSRNSYGSYLRNKGNPVDPNTTPQAVIKSRFATLSSAWRDLDQADRDTFIEQAPNYTRINAFGDNVPLTGQSLYMRANLNMLASGQPLIYNIPPPATNAAPVFDGLLFTKTIPTMTILQLSATTALGAFIINVTDLLSPGIKFVPRSAYRIAAIKPPATALGDFSILNEWEALFGRTVNSSLPAGNVGLYIDCIHGKTGQRFRSDIWLWRFFS